ncbi:hypothetical protein [Actinokineospora sp. HUAS TT18]|uniref:hypothetical protein n=1 Tax=Actinokineospora sp. HUAS TT18 TaxID=3447451 RepID=UPI003F52588C
MNDTQEELIKAAFQRQAERAPDVVRIQAALRAAERPSRLRWVGLTVAAAAAATAITVPIVLTRDLAPTENPVASGEPSPTTVRPATPVREPGLALPYKPTWLPEGFVEFTRSGGGEHEPWSRVWTVNPAEVRWPDLGTQTLIFQRRSGSSLPHGIEQGEVIQVNGVQAYLGRGMAIGGDRGDTAEVIWIQSPGEVLRLSLNGFPNAIETVRRIAQSIEADPVAAVPAEALRFGWLPDGMVNDVVNASGDRPNHYSLFRSSMSGGDKAIQATVSDAPPIWIDEPGINRTETPVTVRGLQGKHVSVSGDTRPSSGIVVQLADGRWLNVGGPPDRDLMVRVANELQIAPLTPMNWIGKP